jgi:predicted homoserine dehydrogenase-like protein
LAELPLDVVVEATGAPEAGARHGLAAIQNGKHVVMVSKETAAVVGPLLAAKAREAGVVYTTGDGDQPSMCIGLLTWAESLGLDVICAGKATEADFVYDPTAGAVTNGRQTVTIAHDGEWDLWPSSLDGLQKRVQARSRALAALPQAGVPEYTEMAIVMNDTGYGHDAATLHGPIVRIPEIAELLRPAADGGLLQHTGVIDVVTCLRRPDEPGMGGGVFVVVRCHDRATWELLRRKGHLLSRDGSFATLYLPYHLLGVETATSVLSAAVLGLPTGGGDARPVVEVGIQATSALPAGRRLALDRDHAIAGAKPVFTPPAPVAPTAAIPFYMAANAVLATDVPAGALLTYAMVQEPPDAVLWALKREQDRRFLTAPGRAIR